MADDGQVEAICSELAAIQRAAGNNDFADLLMEALKLRQSLRMTEARAKATEKELADIAEITDNIATKKKKIDYEIEEMTCINEAGFMSTKNPLFIWGQILISDLNEPLPTWAQDYLQRVASELMRTASDRNLDGDSSLERLKKIFGFSRRRWNAFTDIQRFERASEASALVDAERGRDGAIADIAKKMNVSKNTIYIWRRMAKQHLREATALHRAKRSKAE